jgi:hypothetical protein
LAVTKADWQQGYIFITNYGILLEHRRNPRILEKNTMDIERMA